MRGNLLSGLFVLALWGVAAGAFAGPLSGARGGESKAEREAMRGAGARALSRKSTSDGFPWRGRLKNGVVLAESPYVAYTGEYRAGGHFYGTWELVQLLERAAYRVAKKHPGSKLYVGELSKERGGTISGHGSHQNGRDVDLAFYMLDAGGEQVVPYAFANFDGNGKARAPNKGLRFDDAKNWDLIAKLVTDGDARVQYIFVADPIKRRILAEGERRGAAPSVLRRAREVMVQPATGHPHRNHFHVRIYCPPDDRPSCKDRAPFHPWYPGEAPTVASDETQLASNP